MLLIVSICLSSCFLYLGVVDGHGHGLVVGVVFMYVGFVGFFCSFLVFACSGPGFGGCCGIMFHLCNRASPWVILGH